MSQNTTLSAVVVVVVFFFFFFCQEACISDIINKAGMGSKKKKCREPLFICSSATESEPARPCFPKKQNGASFV